MLLTTALIAGDFLTIMKQWPLPVSAPPIHDWHNRVPYSLWPPTHIPFTAATVLQICLRGMERIHGHGRVIDLTSLLNQSLL
jgi:hypothetical protein